MVDASSPLCLDLEKEREKGRERRGRKLTASSSRPLSLSLSLSLSTKKRESLRVRRASEGAREGDEVGKKEFTNCKMQLSALVRGVSRSAPLEWVAELLYRVCNPASLRSLRAAE